MKLISWNVNGRKSAVREQAQALASREPDIVALQEVRPGSVEGWKDGASRRGADVDRDARRTALPDGRPQLRPRRESLPAG